MKRKFEDIQWEIMSSKAKLQSLQVEKRSMEATQEILEKVQQECQGLKTKKEQLLGKIGDLELQKATLEEYDRQSQGQNAELKE